MSSLRDGGTGDYRRIDVMAPKESPKESTSKKTYQRPKLSAYGKLQDLTTGGTGTASEGSQGQRPRP
jgi:hypothetical protein